jgi:iron complex transport system substrate-binding protein
VVGGSQSKIILCLLGLFVANPFFGGCSRFHNTPKSSSDTRYVVISPVYNEIIWALGAQDKVVGVDLSTTYPPEVKNVQTVGYHRALSAEGILSLHPTEIIHDNNIGPPQVVQQLQQLNGPMKTFTAKNDSFDGTKALIREMGVYLHKEARAEELCNTLDAQRAASLEQVKQYADHPRVAVIHFGRLDSTSAIGASTFPSIVTIPVRVEAECMGIFNPVTSSSLTSKEIASP